MRRGLFVMAGITAGVLLLSVFFQNLGDRTGVLRYQQHLEQPSEEELGPCAVCGSEAELCTHLPIIRIETGGKKIPGRPTEAARKVMTGPVDYDLLYERGDNGEKAIVVSFSVIENQNTWNHPGDAPDIVGEAEFRFRGNSSRWFAKGSYSFKTIEDNDPERRLPMELLGMNSGSEWVLHGPCLDRTLVRNYLCYSVAGQVMDYAPDCRFCELIIEGEYQGVYLLTEAVTKGDGRIEITESEPNNPMTSWIIRLDRDYKSTVPLNSFSFYTFRLDNAQADLLYPGKNTVTPEKINYVTSELSSIERLLYSNDFSKSPNGYADYLDTKAFAQYYLLNEFFGNVDAGRYSTYYYKDIRGKITPVVWDFNNACDNYISYAYGTDGLYVNRMSPFDRLLNDEDFVDEVIRQYRLLRKSYLSNEYLTATIDDTISYLGDSITRNNTAWNSLYDLSQFDDENYLFPASRNYQEYQDAVAQLKTWIVDRGQWMDEHIDSLRQFCHPSRLANRTLG